MSPLPLHDVRIIDLSIVWAGPHGARLLADMGADVIKVEALTRMDPIRGQANASDNEGMYPDGKAGERPFNRHGYFSERNRNKRSLTLDLKAEPTHDAFQRLVAVSDVVLDNFAAGVMDRLGLGYDDLQAIKPDIIVVQMPSFGTTGPEASYRGFGATNDQLSGLVAITGYEPPADRQDAGQTPQPQNLGINASDPIAGAHATVAILVALARRRRTGEGAFIDLAHRESATRLLGYELADASLNGRIAQPRGNGHRSWLQDLYRSASDDQGEASWLALTIRHDADWQALSTLIDDPALDHPNYATALRRWKHRHQLKPLIEQWTAQRTPHEAAAALQALGLPAAPTQAAPEYFNDPHLRARDWWQRIDSPETGAHDYYGITWKNRNHPGDVRLPAPALGAHNHEILVDLLGYTESEYQALVDTHLIGTDPRRAPTPPSDTP